MVSTRIRWAGFDIAERRTDAAYDSSLRDYEFESKCDEGCQWCTCVVCNVLNAGLLWQGVVRGTSIFFPRRQCSKIPPILQSPALKWLKWSLNAMDFPILGLWVLLFDTHTKKRLKRTNNLCFLFILMSSNGYTDKECNYIIWVKGSCVSKD